MIIIDYKAEFGEIVYPKGFDSLLDGLTIAEQMKFFRLGNGLYLKVPFQERRFSKYDRADKLDDNPKIKAIIVKDNKIAGVKVLDHQIWEEVICKPERGYCSYYEEELDGSGYKTCSFNSYLICVSNDFE